MFALFALPSLPQDRRTEVKFNEVKYEVKFIHQIS